MNCSRIYDFKCIDCENKVYSFENLKNKVVIIVNVASLCGFTPQYRDLQSIYEKYKSQGLEILAFPSNQFGGQEPEPEELIAKNIRKKYGVTFPIMKKIKVNGLDECPIYTYLKNEKKGMLGFKGVRWNFEKFIVDRDGQVVARYNTTVTPIQLEPLIKELICKNKLLE